MASGNDRSQYTPSRVRRSAEARGLICNASRVPSYVASSRVTDTFGDAYRIRTESTHDQHPEAQHDALTAAGCEQIFIDTESGKLARRPELDKALLSANRPGDQLVVTKLDRLGRSLENLIDLSNTLQVRGVDLVVLDQGIDPPLRWGGCSSKYLARSPSSNAR